MSSYPDVGARAHDAWVGLSASEATRRLVSDGANELPGDKQRSLLALVRDVLSEPMFLLLLGAAGVYLLLGDAGDAAVLACSLVAVVGITVYQERRTDRTLRALRDLSTPRALVVRDGEQLRIPGREVVRGDLVIVREGDRIPADAVLRESIGIAVDESLLTGESVPVSKRGAVGTVERLPPGGDDLPLVYSGTLTVRGHGIAEVLATGPRTQVGMIGGRLAELAQERTPLQRQTSQIVRVIAIAGLVLCALLTLVLAVRGSFLEGALAGITLAMSLLPEEFPVVLTVFLALGAWRISKHRVLTRRAPVIEALGAATVLAVDKTGTLTENRMMVQVVECGETRIELAHSAGGVSRDVEHTLAIAMGACELDVVDPMDRAIVQAATTHASRAIERFQSMHLIREYDLTADLLAVIHVWQATREVECDALAKGAPEDIACLCRLDDPARSALLDRANELARNGMRVLAVAHASVHATALPDNPRTMVFALDGLLGLVDPVRPAVPDAIAECRTAGIRVIMITGDHPSTALAVAKAIHLDVGSGVLTGPEVQRMDRATLAERVRSVNVYARMVPEQKLALVQAMKASGEIVAMTGDGVNDAPALKAAHIGVAMGRRGSDVAREAASLVLLDDDFSALVAAVRAGRRIFDNIRNAMSYLVAVHIPLGGMGLLPALLGWPLFLFPVHVVFLEFVIDPACSLVFEAERASANVMRRPPRPATDRVFDTRLVLTAAMLGVSILLAVAMTYAIVLYERGGDAARGSAFATLVVGNLLLIATSRSRTLPALAVLFRPNAAFVAIAGGVIAALIVVLYWPPAVHLFRFDSPTPREISIAVGLGVASVLWYDVVKFLRWGFRAR